MWDVIIDLVVASLAGVISGIVLKFIIDRWDRGRRKKGGKV